MAELKPGDAVPSDCTAVDKLPVRMLTSDGGTLAYADGTGVTSVGKLLMSSREQDYRDAFAANGLTICGDDELGYDFCLAESPLRLPLKGGTRLQVLVHCMTNTTPGTDSGAPMLTFNTLALQLIMATVTKGDRKILALDDSSFFATAAEFFANEFPGVDFTGWELAYASAQLSESDVRTALADTTVSVIYITSMFIAVTGLRPTVFQILEEEASHLRSHVAAGGGLLAQHQYTYENTTVPPATAYDVDLYQFDTSGNATTRYDLAFVDGYQWLPVVFPDMTLVVREDVYYEGDPGHDRSYDNLPIVLTSTALATIAGTTSDMLYFADSPLFYRGKGHFAGDLNGLAVFAVGGGITNCAVGGIPSFSALA